jgi:hypothetical protein
MKSLDTLGPDFMLRQNITAYFKGRELSFSAVLQKKSDKLTIVGLTPMGTRAFLLEKQDQSIRFKNYVNRDLPFSPKFMLSDIQFIFEISEVQVDGRHERTEGPVHITEDWKSGKLFRRVAHIEVSGHTQRLVIEYNGGSQRNAPAPIIIFTNEDHGYRLEIENSDYKKLDDLPTTSS